MRTHVYSRVHEQYCTIRSRTERIDTNWHTTTAADWDTGRDWREEVVRRFRLAVLIIASTLLVLLLVKQGVHNWFGSSSYGKEKILLADGTKVYVVRELWGHRERLHITQDVDGCKPGDERKDYLGPINTWSFLLYKVQPQGWSIYSDIVPREILSPFQAWSEARPVLVAAKNPGIEDLYRDRYRYGISVMDVPLNEACLINIFRLENSLR